MTRHCTFDPPVEPLALSPIDCAREARMMILCDPEGGALPCLMIPADFADAGAINLMATHARGLVCLALDSRIVDRLQLALQPQSNRRRFATPFTLSIEATHAVSTGISAPDRARTVAAAIHPEAVPGDLATPGHVFPIRVERDGPRAGGCIPGAAVEICDRAGLRPAAVICEILDPMGAAPGREWLQSLAAALDLPVFACGDLRG